METVKSSVAPLTPRVRRLRAGVWSEPDEILAREIPVPVLYEKGEVCLWAWPHDCETLAAGHVLLDCLHDAAPDEPSPSGIPCARVQQEGNALRVTLLPAGSIAPLPSPPALSAGDILTHMGSFLQRPGLWDNTGCYHRAALLHTTTGRIVRVVEDIGRHNCLDRLAGFIALSGGSARSNPVEYALLVTARITASLYNKARRLGLCMLISRSAVTSASFEAAHRQGVTLVGFCRPDEERFTVFADPENRLTP